MASRRFLPTRPLLYTLTRHKAAPALPPAIARVHPGTTHFIHDVYYGSADERLSAAGLWVRQRSVLVGSSSSCTSSWEAKVPVGGNFAASQFVEVEGAVAVERELRRVLGGPVAVDTIAEHLGVICDLATCRLSGRLELRCPDDDDDALRNLTAAVDIVVATPTGGSDFADMRDVLELLPAWRDSGEISNGTSLFFHEIGELQLMAEVPTVAKTKNQTHAHEHETRRAAIAAARAAQLEAFMRAHPVLFPTSPLPCGKLEAYLAYKEGRRDRAEGGYWGYFEHGTYTE